MGLPLLLVAAAAYLLGCSNGAVIVSKYILRDDVRTHGSGNAGLTNFYRTFGGPLTLVVILCDVPQGGGRSVGGHPDGPILGRRLLEPRGHRSGLCQVLGGPVLPAGPHVPLHVPLQGGKGILSGGTIAIMIDWRIALVVWGDS